MPELSTTTHHDRTLLSKRTFESVRVIDPELELLRATTFAKLEEIGLVTVLDYKERKLIQINDLDAFSKGAYPVRQDGATRNITLKPFLESCARKLLDDERYGQGKTGNALHLLFDGVAVITKQELEGLRPGTDRLPEDIPAKSMFYVPSSESAALDPQILQKTRNTFYLYLPQVVKGNWFQPQPTQVGNSSGLSMFESTVAQMIYGQGLAERGVINGTEVLMVLDDITDSNSPKSPITGAWLSEQFGFPSLRSKRTGHPLKWVDSGKQIIREFGGRLIPQLLRPEDLTAKPLNSVDQNGMWYLRNAGVRYILGDRHASESVVQLSDTEYITVDSEGVPTSSFSTTIRNRRSARNTSTGRSSSVLVASQDAYEKGGVDRLNFSIIRIDEGRKKTEKIQARQELPRLIKFRQLYAERIGSLTPLNELSPQEQILIARITEQHSDKAWQLLELSGGKALTVMAKSSMYGPFDTRILNLSEHFTPKTESLLDHYALLNLEIRRLHNGLMQRLDKTLFDTRTKSSVGILITRIAEALEYRSRLFVVASGLGYESESLEEAKLIFSATQAIADIFRGSPRYKLSSTSPNLSADKSVTSVSVNYDGEAGSKLTITIRPQAIESDQPDRAAQARIGFKYTGPGGTAISIRVDADPHGTSLDLGSRGGSTVTFLNAIGESHHTPEPFDKAFNNPKEFAKIALAFAQILGFSFNHS